MGHPQSRSTQAEYIDDVAVLIPHGLLRSTVVSVVRVDVRDLQISFNRSGQRANRACDIADMVDEMAVRAGM